MKKPILLLLLTAVIMLAIPMLALLPEHTGESAGTPTEITPFKTVTVYRTDEKAAQTVDITEYLAGVLGCEISPEYQTEAIKAQAVAARTLLLRRIKDGSCSQPDCDITDDPGSDQGYIDLSERQKKWGDSFSEYEKKIEKCVRDTDGIVITYDSEPIFAAYHAISPGKTESSENVWGGEYPYLKSVESVGDMLSTDYMSKVSVSAADYAAAAKKLGCPDIGNPESDSSPEYTAAGTVKSYELCGKKVSGVQMRSAFSLRSACFTVEKQDGGFVFTVRGYGHGVGMSQYGANYMAQQGADYEEILKWYYTGVQISDRYGAYK